MKLTWLRILIPIAFCSLFLDAHAADLRFFSNYSYIDGRGSRTGSEYELTGTYDYYKRSRLELGYSVIGKSYANTEILYDRYIRLGHTAHINEEFYFYSSFEKNISRHYGADWSLYLDPHYIYASVIDLGIGGQFKSYPVHRAWALRPTITFYIMDGLSISGRSDIALKPERAASGEGALSFDYLKLSTRIAAGGGKTDEGDGLIDDFKQITFEAGYRHFGFLKVKGFYQIYRGDLRKENRYGAGLELTAF